MLHSIWQIILVYLLLRLLLNSFKNSSSFLRYGISVTALFSVLIISLATFYIYYQSERAGIVQISGIIKELQQSKYTVPDNLPDEGQYAGSGGIQKVLPWLVYIYFAGVLLMSFRLTASLLYLRKYRKKGIIEPDGEFLKGFSELLEKYHINRKVGLIESLIAKTPMVIGYLRPLVIVPVGIFTHLPFNQVEAVLAHELAHIKRNDFLLNILQSVIELLFFYHPAIYLISKHIKEERENCCDDIALSHCKNSSHYVKALARMEGILPVNPYPAVAFVNQKNSLLNRMKRILKPKTMKTKVSDRIIAGIIILAGSSLLLLTGVAAMNNISGGPSELIKDESSTNTDINTSDSFSVKDTIVEINKNRIVIIRKNKKNEKEKVEMTFKEGKLADLKIDGKTIPRKDHEKYRDLINDTRKEVSAASAEVAKAEKDLEEIDEEEIERKIEEALREAKSIQRVEIYRELEKARAELEEIDQEEIRREVELALDEAEREMDSAHREAVNWDEIRMEVENAMGSIDWEEIKESIRQGMKDAELSEEEMKNAMEEASRAMEEIDWAEIQESVHYGLESARNGLAEIEWDLIGESIELSLNITGDVLDNIIIEMESAFNEIDKMGDTDVKSGIQQSRLHVNKEKKKLDELERNMEEALEELEKK